MWAIAEGTDGTVWAGGIGGLFEYADGKWKTLTRASGLSNTEVLSLGAGPNGVIWVGYRFGGGIDRVHPQAGGVAIEKGVQRRGSDGLVYFLDFDSTGRLWAGTELGVDVWDGARWSHYDMNDGMAMGRLRLERICRRAERRRVDWNQWRTLALQAPPNLAPNAPIKVIFTRLAIGRQDVSGLRDPSFGIHANSLVARYSALNATRENGVVFRYRLEGAASSWTETSQRELQFANLAPGRYRLEVEARESDGVWSGHGAEFPFRILTPWYSTWWFISLCILIPLSAVAIFMRLRFLSALSRESELVRLVAEKTADLSRANEELSLLSFTDPLTGLFNRRVFDQSLEKECTRLSQNRERPFAAQHRRGSIQSAQRLSRSPARRRISCSAWSGVTQDCPPPDRHCRPRRRGGVRHHSSHHWRCRRLADCGVGSTVYSRPSVAPSQIVGCPLPDRKRRRGNSHEERISALANL